MTPGLNNKPTMHAALAAVVLATAPAVWFARADGGATHDRPPEARTDDAPPAVAAAAPAGAPSAGAPSAAQTPGDKTPGESLPARRGPAADRPRGPRMPDLRPVPPAEWTEISDFMAGYMPWRIDEVRQMPEGQLKERIKRLLANRYRGLRAIEGRDPEAYEQRLGQLKIEDQVYRLVSQWSGSDTAGRDKIREQLRAEVGRLVDVDIQERQRRVARLEEELRRQKKVLEQDVRDRDSVVERRLGRFLDWGNRWPSRQRKAAAEDKSIAKPGEAKQDRPNDKPPTSAEGDSKP